MSRRVLITGGAGFVGQWLSRALLQQGWTVFAGTVDGAPRSKVLSEEETAAVHWLSLDVQVDEDIRRAIDTSAPDRVVHLAGIAFAPEANASPIRAFEINALGCMRLLGGLAAAGRGTTRVLVIGSAEEYGSQPDSAYPIGEDAILRPLTPYAVAKASQELIALQAFRASDFPTICTRSFNHSGVGHGDSYLLPTLVRRVQALPRTGGSLRIGNGAVIRDYLHVADVVQAYQLLLEKGSPGQVYNVCSGQGITVRALAERVLARAGMNAEITSDDALRRPIDVPILIGDNTKLRSATGWSVTRSIDDIIDDLIHAAPR